MRLLTLHSRNVGLPNQRTEQKSVRRRIRGKSAELLGLLVTTILSCSTVFAEIAVNERFSVDAAIRYRMEVDGRDFHEPFSANEYAYLRSFMGFTLTNPDQLKLRLKFIDARRLGTSYPNKTSSAYTNLHEGYIEVDRFFVDNLRAQFGRFELTYGRQRVLGAGEWTNEGPRTYDGIRLIAKPDFGRFDLFALKIYERGFGEIDSYPSNTNGFEFGSKSHKDRLLLGIYSHLLGESLQPFILVDWDEMGFNRIDADLFTSFGFYGYRLWGRVKLEADAVYQGGEYRGITHSSWMFAPEATVTLDGTLTPFTGAGLDVASGGNSSSTNDLVYRGDYYAKHRFRGLMDVMTGDEKAGLWDGFVKFGMKPTGTSEVVLTVHYFQLINDRYRTDNHQPFKALGTEADLRGRITIRKSLALDTAICYFSPTDDWKPNGDPAIFGYLALVLGL